MVSIKKRSQVTVFIIIGIVILVILALILIFNSQRLKIDDNLVLPQELMPAKNYVDYCVDSTVEAAFYLLGRQSGFLNIPLEIRSTPGRRLQFGHGAEIVPYWYYDNKNYIPTIPFVESELNSYISMNFVRCIGEFESLQGYLEIRSLAKNATTRVSINDKDVTVQIKFPLQIVSEVNKLDSRISQFSRLYNVKLKDMLDVSKYILAYENTNNFFEEITLAWMAMDEKIPFNGMMMECRTRQWMVKDVKSEIQKQMAFALPEVRVEGTDYFPFQEDESKYARLKSSTEVLKRKIEAVPLYEEGGMFMDDYESYEKKINAIFSDYQTKVGSIPNDSFYYHNMYMPMEYPSRNNAFNTFAIDFTYSPDFGMDMQVKPSSHGVMRSNSVSGPQKYLSFLCINIFHFTYDVTYPIIVTVTDPDAFNGHGYKFRYAFPIIIRNNEAKRSKQQIEYAPNNEFDDEFCMYSDDERKVIIKAYDREIPTRTLLGVNVSMICARKKCALGKTESFGGEAYVRSTITSACSNPILKLEKEGYLPAQKQIADDDDLAEIGMIKMKNFSLDFSMHQLRTNSSLTLGNPFQAGSISLHISGIADDTQFDTTQYFTAGEPNWIMLPVIDGDYDISITYFKNAEDFSGGYYGVWQPSGARLVTANKLRLHVVEVLPSLDDEELARSVDAINKIAVPFMRPELI